MQIHESPGGLTPGLSWLVLLGSCPFGLYASTRNPLFDSHLPALHFPKGRRSRPVLLDQNKRWASKTEHRTVLHQMSLSV